MFQNAFKGASQSYIIRKLLTPQTIKEYKLDLKDKYGSDKNKVIRDYYGIEFEGGAQHEFLLYVLMKTNEYRKQLYTEKIDELKNITVDEKIRLIFHKHYEDENGKMQQKYITVDLPKRYDMYNNQMANFKLSKSNISQIDKYLEISNDIFLLSIDEFIEGESGYELLGFIGVICNIDKYNPLKARSYF